MWLVAKSGVCSSRYERIVQETTLFIDSAKYNMMYEKRYTLSPAPVSGNNDQPELANEI